MAFQAGTAADCGGNECAREGEFISWIQVAAVGCQLFSQSADTCVVHVTAYPATITLQVTSTLTCVGSGGDTKSCSDTKVRRICFTQVTGYESQRCGRYPPHPNKNHGTKRCT